MSSTINVEDCCCPEQTCGYCSQSNIGRGGYVDERAGWKLYYCMEGLELRPESIIVNGAPVDNYFRGGYDPDTYTSYIPSNPNYGAKCASTEVLQLTFDPYRFNFLGTDPEVDGPCRIGDSKQYFKEMDIVLRRTEHDPCQWRATDENGIDLIYPLEMSNPRKVCVKYQCCGLNDGETKFVFASNITTADIEIFYVEFRVTAACVDTDLLAQRWNKPIGTCGRVIELKVKFRTSDQFQDDPECIPGCNGNCNKHHCLFGGNTCNRAGMLPAGGSFMDGAVSVPLQVYDFRGGTYWNGWFFTSCGCMPYCWVDDKACDVCGDYSDSGDNLGAFRKLDTPLLSTDVLGRDRLCNAKDCGCWGCITRLAYDPGNPDGGGYCTETQGGSTGAYEEAQCGGTGKYFSQFTDSCGRGATYSHQLDSGDMITGSLGWSTVVHPDTPGDGVCEEYPGSWDYPCCTASIPELPAPFSGDGCAEQVPGSSWDAQPKNIESEQHPNPNDLRPFSMSWRIVPA